MPDVLSVFSGMGSGLFGGIMSSLKIVLYSIPFIAVIAFFAMVFRNKSLYRHPVRIFRIRENGKVKENNFKGGYIGRKNSAPFFRIKKGFMPNQNIDLTTTPKVEYMDEDDRVYYLQIDVNTFVQLKRDMNIKIKTEKDKNDKITSVSLNKKEFEFTPVESDVKYGAILSCQKIRGVLRLEPTWQKLLPYFGITIMAVIFIVAWSLLMDKC